MGGIHLGPVNSPHKGPVTRKMFPFDDVIMYPVLHTATQMQYITKNMRIICTLFCCLEVWYQPISPTFPRLLNCKQFHWSYLETMCKSIIKKQNGLQRTVTKQYETFCMFLRVLLYDKKITCYPRILYPQSSVHECVTLNRFYWSNQLSWINMAIYSGSYGLYIWCGLYLDLAQQHWILMTFTETTVYGPIVAKSPFRHDAMKTGHVAIFVPWGTCIIFPLSLYHQLSLFLR